MSNVQSQIDRIRNNIDAAYIALGALGVDVPEGATVDELGPLISSIEVRADIPTYHYSEAARILRKIDGFKAAHPNNLVFGVVSDIHMSSIVTAKNSAKHAAFALETVGAMVGCDFVANLGDNPEESNINDELGLEQAQGALSAVKPALDRLSSFNLVGNHDKCIDTQKQYNLIGVHNDFDVAATTQIRGFGYKDFEDKKVRVIVLNTCDYLNDGGGCALSYEQKDFLMRALDLSGQVDAFDWQILLLSHIPLDWNGGDYNFYPDLQTILNAYEDGTTATIAVNTSYARNEDPTTLPTYSGGNLIYNYSGKNGAKLIANIHGHLHNNKVGKIANTNIMRIATASANAIDGYTRAEAYPDYGDYSITVAEAEKIKKSGGTARDTSATFYCVDLDGQVVYAYGYGADIDRTVIYKDAVLRSVSYNLTNCASSNTAESVVDGDTYTTTITVPNSRGTLDSVMVTMGSVDVTASAYADGVVTIAEVTGDIVITAVASIPIYWNISERSEVAIRALASYEKDISADSYYVGASSTGALYGTGGYITDLTVNGNDVTFTSTSKDVGIGLPYRLKAGKSYTFSAKATASARLRWCYLNANGTYADQQGYSSSGTTLTMTINAPADETMWAMIIIDTNTVNTSITYTDIVFEEA